MFDIPLHKLIIHFPIALTIIAAIYDSWGVYSNKAELHQAGYGLTLWAAVSAIAAVVSGLQMADLRRVEPGPLTGHAVFGIAACVTITVAGMLRYSAHARGQRGYRVMPWLVLQLGSAVLVIVTAVMGHKL